MLEHPPETELPARVSYAGVEPQSKTGVENSASLRQERIKLTTELQNKVLNGGVEVALAVLKV